MPTNRRIPATRRRIGTGENEHGIGGSGLHAGRSASKACDAAAAALLAGAASVCLVAALAGHSDGRAVSGSVQRVLLHVCCGPCAAGCVDRFPPGWSPVLFYSNSNIATIDEYRLRLEQVRILASARGLPLVEEAYDHAAWRAAVAGLEAEPEGGARCARCFRFSLARAAARAAATGCARYTTTLTVSPRKRSADVIDAGRATSGAAGFWELDFKKGGGFARGVAVSRSLGLYRQTFCGCEFSKEAPARSLGRPPAAAGNSLAAEAPKGFNPHREEKHAE